MFSQAFAQESPDEAKRRAALEAERRALEERKLREQDEARRQEMDEAKRKAELERARKDESGKSQPQAQFTSTLIGTVANEQGIAIGNCEIHVFYDSMKTAGESRSVPQPASVQAGRSNADGSFRVDFTVIAIAGLATLKLGIHVLSNDYLPGPQLDLEARAGGKHDGLAIVLRAGAEVSGRVTDTSGAPLANTLVRAIRDTGLERAAGKQSPVEQTREARTDRNGNYAIKGLHAGKFEVSTECTGWGSTDYTPKLELADRAAKTGFDFKLPKVTALFANVKLSDGATKPVRVQVLFADKERQGSVASGVIENGRLAVETGNTGKWTIEIVAKDYKSSGPIEVDLTENQHHELGEIKLTRKSAEDYPQLPND